MPNISQTVSGKIRIKWTKDYFQCHTTVRIRSFLKPTRLRQAMQKSGKKNFDLPFKTLEKRKDIMMPENQPPRILVCSTIRVYIWFISGLSLKSLSLCLSLTLIFTVILPSRYKKNNKFFCTPGLLKSINKVT